MAKKEKNRKEYLIRELLKEIDKDPDREGLLKTPQRVAKMFDFLTRGYHQDVAGCCERGYF